MNYRNMVKDRLLIDFFGVLLLFCLQLYYRILYYILIKYNGNKFVLSNDTNNFP